MADIQRLFEDAVRIEGNIDGRSDLQSLLRRMDERYPELGTAFQNIVDASFLDHLEVETSTAVRAFLGPNLLRQAIAMGIYSHR
jgi:hypothetical protein